MKTSMMFLTALLTFSTGASNANVFASEDIKSVAYDYETTWCRDAGFILRGSLEAAYNAQTFEEEVVILRRAVQRTLSKLNPKFAYYLESTLVLGLKLEASVSSSKDKALVLRRNIENALSDLTWLDGRFHQRYSQDHSYYIKKILNRVLDEALRSKTDQMETIILDAGASSAIQILAESDNRRDPRNACAVRYLKEALDFNDLYYKRDLIQQAMRSLNYGCGF